MFVDTISQTTGRHRTKIIFYIFSFFIFHFSFFIFHFYFPHINETLLQSSFVVILFYSWRCSTMIVYYYLLSTIYYTIIMLEYYNINTHKTHTHTHTHTHTYPTLDGLSPTLLIILQPNT